MCDVACVLRHQICSSLHSVLQVVCPCSGSGSIFHRNTACTGQHHWVHMESCEHLRRCPPLVCTHSPHYCKATTQVHMQQMSLTVEIPHICCCIWKHCLTLNLNLTSNLRKVYFTGNFRTTQHCTFTSIVSNMYTLPMAFRHSFAHFHKQRSSSIPIGYLGVLKKYQYGIFLFDPIAHVIVLLHKSTSKTILAASPNSCWKSFLLLIIYVNITYLFIMSGWLYMVLLHTYIAGWWVKYVQRISRRSPATTPHKSWLHLNSYWTCLSTPLTAQCLTDSLAV